MRAPILLFGGCNRVLKACSEGWINGASGIKTLDFYTEFAHDGIKTLDFFTLEFAHDAQ